MKKNDCNVIRDLMPLVLDRVASDESRGLVEEHMETCEECRKEYEKMKADMPQETLAEYEEEQRTIHKAQFALDADKSIPCTGCHYCTEGCPMGIPIPDIFTVANRRKGSPEFRTKREYAIVTQGKGKASECVQCGQCEGACPQHLPIISLLENCRAMES